MIGTLAFVGLTGGIGSGKSTVAAMLARLGVPVIDADQLARAVVAPGQPALREILALWPDVVLRDDELDRARLGARVFADPNARRQLERITHPRIARLAHERAEALAAQGHRLAVYEASLLVETGRHKEYDALVVVAASEAAQVARVMARSHLPREQAEARVRAQFPLAEKLSLATYVVHNDGDLSALQTQVDALAQTLRQRFAAEPCPGTTAI